MAEVNKSKEKELFKKRAVELMAHKFFTDYCRAKMTTGLQLLEPEEYFENWCHINMSRVDDEFKDGVFKSFMKMLSRRVHG